VVQHSESKHAVPARLLARFRVQASRERRQRTPVAQPAERHVHGPADLSIRLGEAQPLEERLDGLPLATVTERLGGAAARLGLLEGQPPQQRLERDGPVLPAVAPGGDGARQEQDQQAGGESPRGRQPST
jgi:hypothetical protein